MPTDRYRVPHGWQLVPIEPTGQMMDEIKFYDAITDVAISKRYQAMLAVTPQPPPPDGPDEEEEATFTIDWQRGYACAETAANGRQAVLVSLLRDALEPLEVIVADDSDEEEALQDLLDRIRNAITQLEARRVR